MRPIDIPTGEVSRFVRDHLPAQPARILEVGCGSGDLALRLQQDGHDLVALDESEAAVQQVSAKGITAHHGHWPDFEDEPFDAILFTRSLHHIWPLDPALDQVMHLLKPDGVVMVEEFDFPAARPTEVAWLYGTLRLLEACDQLDLHTESLASRLLAGDGDYALWRRGEDLHPVSAILNALVERFDLTVNESSAHLYRFVIPLLSDDATGYELAARLLDMEQRLADSGALARIGRRFVGQKR
ncbi:MAG: class I SAM-dependent methyltransferase [Anaerolineae bacterium]|nr:class I SAM-dependent methyltransferase [Anaerolineae bacterium]